MKRTRKQTPIPNLAAHIATFSGMATKQERAQATADLAEKIYRASVKVKARVRA
jgi:hypothetical protein